jgi:hypothetical protein
MQTRRDFMTWLSAMSLAGLTRPLVADEGAERKAAAAARAWLNLVDGGRYATSWEAAAPAFQSAVTQEQWDRAVHSVRTPLGRCLSRTLRSHKLVDPPPGAPKGPYVVLQFETAFEHGADAVETVTPVLGEDGRWRVAGYFINQEPRSLSTRQAL